MYLVSVLDDQPVIEASLGGRVDLAEMKAFAEELEECFEDWNGQSFYVLIDYSKAFVFDTATTAELIAIKEKAFELGAAKVFSVPQEDTELEEHVAARFQEVIEGREEFLAVACQADFAPLPVQRIARAA